MLKHFVLPQIISKKIPTIARNMCEACFDTNSDYNVAERKHCRSKKPIEIFFFKRDESNVEEFPLLQEIPFTTSLSWWLSLPTKTAVDTKRSRIEINSIEAISSKKKCFLELSTNNRLRPLAVVLHQSTIHIHRHISRLQHSIRWLSLVSFAFRTFLRRLQPNRHKQANSSSKNEDLLSRDVAKRGKSF